MRIFLYEYTCASEQIDESQARSLRVEGWAMLSALLDDFARIPGTLAFTLLADRFDPAPAWRYIQRVPGGEHEPAFRAAARSADYTLVIAPEFDDLLLTHCHWAEAAGSRLLGSSPDAIQLAGDKLALCGRLKEHGIPTPDSTLVAAGQPLPWVGLPAVCKPRHGAGSGATFLLPNAHDLPDCVARARNEEPRDDFLLQPMIPGQPVSVAFLLGPRQRLALPAATQELSTDGRFRYRGGSVPLPPEQNERAQRLARRAVNAVPGLQGYVGVDLVLGAAADGSQDVAIEINPRMTTSYVGLRALAVDNLTEVMLRVFQGEAMPKLRWRDGKVAFLPDGRTT